MVMRVVIASRGVALVETKFRADLIESDRASAYFLMNDRSRRCDRNGLAVDHRTDLSELRPLAKFLDELRERFDREVRVLVLEIELDALDLFLDPDFRIVECRRLFVRRRCVGKLVYYLRLENTVVNLSVRVEGLELRRADIHVA